MPSAPICQQPAGILRAPQTRPGKRPHALDVLAREPLDSRELRPDVAREPLDDPRAPTALLLTLNDLPPQVPVQLDQLTIDRQNGLGPGRTDALLQVIEKARIVVRQGFEGHT